MWIECEVWADTLLLHVWVIEWELEWYADSSWAPYNLRWSIVAWLRWYRQEDLLRISGGATWGAIESREVRGLVQDLDWILPAHSLHKTREDDDAYAEIHDEVEEVLIVGDQTLAYYWFCTFWERPQKLDQGFVIEHCVAIKSQVESDWVFLILSHSIKVYSEINHSFLTVLGREFNDRLYSEAKAIYVAGELLWKIFVQVKPQLSLLA